MIITPDDEGYGIAISDLQGCFSHALKWEDIPSRAREAIEAWVGGAIKDGDPIPEPAKLAEPVV